MPDDWNMISYFYDWFRWLKYGLRHSWIENETENVTCILCVLDVLMDSSVYLSTFKYI